jgi:predicted NACHT family NTPase
MSLPEDFLTQLEQYAELSPGERTVFLAIFGRDLSRVQATQELIISESSLSTYLTGIYKKFKLGGSGPTKENRLREFLIKRFSQAQSLTSSTPDALKPTINELVQEMRQKIQPSIQERCGLMRVLDMSVPIELDDIYTSVNILEKLTGHKRRELNDLWRDISLKDFDRFSLSHVRESRMPALEAVERFKKMLIVGKPGAGKTTFLKNLAIQCIRGKFKPKFVPIFITLKDFAEATGHPNLLDYIQWLINTMSYTDIKASIKAILRVGKALILLDGLDEVKESDSNYVLGEIQKFSNQFHRNQFIITCRIAAQDYIFEQFTEVEIADFDDQQIATFAQKWFHNKHDTLEATRFLQKLKANPPIRELATSPILLTLLCLVFEDSRNFPSNRSELYKEGLDVLLKKWDAMRKIERDRVYKGLSLKRKEDLLSELACSTFKDGNYFFKQREAERQITKYLQNLPDASTNPEILQLDSKALLKSIETQHGLLVERAKSIYSFSHLTFHEYFTARKIVSSCNPYQPEDEVLKELVSHLTEKHWREVFLLTVEMLLNANCLLRMMKDQVDKLLAGDETLQQFLHWIDEKSKSISASVEGAYKPVVIRAFYLDFDIALDPDRTLGCLLDFSLTRVCACASFLARALNLEFSDAFDQIAPELNINESRAIEPALAITLARVFFIDNYLDHIGRSSELGQKLQQLKAELPNPFQSNEETLSQWWEDNGQAWGDRLRKVMIPHRSLGEQWRFNEFSDEQQELLRQYYYANLLLVVCLRSDCYSDPSVRQEIEETLLLPVAGCDNNIETGC